MNINRPENEQDEIDAVVCMLYEAFGRTPGDVMLTGYQIGLLDIPVEGIQKAAVIALRTCKKFPPTVAELRELCGEHTGADRAILAFDALSSAVTSVGSYRSVDFDDPIINATVRSHGGWERICGLTVTEFDKWFRMDFLKTYAALLRTGVSAEAAEPLIGLTDKSNGLLGYEQKPPTKITTGLPALGHRTKPLISKTVLPKIEFHSTEAAT